MTTAPVMSITDELLAELYQILGAHGASEKVLDQVQAASAGEPLPHASLLPYEAPAAQEPVAWRYTSSQAFCRKDRKWHYQETFPHAENRSVQEIGLLEPLYTAPPAAEQPYSTTSDRYRAELYDEVWSQARLIGFGNVTDALAELQRMKLSEQPDTEKLRELIDLVMRCDITGGGVLAAQRAAHALLGKEGE